MNKRYYEHTLPIIRGSLSNTYGDNGFAASFTISIFNVLIATFLFSNGVKIELC